MFVQRLLQRRQFTADDFDHLWGKMLAQNRVRPAQDEFIHEFREICVRNLRALQLRLRRVRFTTGQDWTLVLFRKLGRGAE